MQKRSVNQTKEEDGKVVSCMKMVYNYSIKTKLFFAGKWQLHRRHNK